MALRRLLGGICDFAACCTLPHTCIVLRLVKWALMLGFDVPRISFLGPLAIEVLASAM